MEELVIRAWDMFFASQDVGNVKSRTDSMFEVGDRVGLIDHSCRTIDLQEMPILVLITVVMRLTTCDLGRRAGGGSHGMEPRPARVLSDYATRWGASRSVRNQQRQLPDLPWQDR